MSKQRKPYSPLPQGMSLIELMVALVIIAIISSVAYPSYQSHMAGARRADAQAVLIEAAAFMERFYTENNRYDQDTGGTAVALPAQLAESPRDTGTKAYDIVVQASTASSFTLRATPKNMQAGDGFLEITNTFAKAWDSNNNGTIGSGDASWAQY